MKAQRNFHDNALMLGKGTSAQWFLVSAKEVVERLFRPALLPINMSSYVPKCAIRTDL